MSKKALDPSAFSGMPLPLVARCVSFLVASSTDVAALRLVCKAFGRALKSNLLSCSSTSLKGGSFIQCPLRKDGEGSFVAQLLKEYDPHDMYDTCDLSPGEVLNVEDQHTITFPGSCILRELYPVDAPISEEDQEEEEEDNSPAKKKTKTALDNELEDETDRAKKLVEVCNAITKVTTADELKALAGDAKRLGLYDPCEKGDNEDGGDEEDEGDEMIIPCMLKIWLPRGDQADCIDGKITLEDGSKVLTLNSAEAGSEPDDDNLFMRLLHLGCKYHAVVHSEERGIEAFVLVKIVVQEDTFQEILDDCTVIRNTVIDHVWNRFQQQTPVEGVMIVDAAIASDLQSQLLKQVNELAAKQEADKEIDYHPNSKDVVRDLLHPGLYPYVKEVTPLRSKPEEVPACVFPGKEITESASEQVEGEDFWGRTYETSKYQWLPTYFSISVDGKCTIEDYINNLTPRDNPIKSPLYESLARLFEQSLPYIESVYSYVRAVRPMLRGKDENIEFDSDGLKELKVEPFPLRGQRLQVITKIVDYELIPGQEHSGVWHIEGMSHEEVVLTALYILDRDDEIGGSELEFKRALLRDEAQYIFSHIAQRRPDSLEEIVSDGLVPMGQVESPAGRLIVFPNSHVHKIQTMIHKRLQGSPGKSKAKRRIVVFFLVNPLRRIVSTREVAPQQGAGAITHDDALAHRLALMQERKFHKQDWNVRTVELCEH